MAGLRFTLLAASLACLASLAAAAGPAEAVSWEG